VSRENRNSQNYCTDSNHILLNDKHQQVHVVGAHRGRSLQSKRLSCSVLFSPLGKLAGRAIYFTLRNFFLSFTLISPRQIISRSAGPIFATFTSNESFLAVDDRSGPLFRYLKGRCHGNRFCGKMGQNCLHPCTYRSGIQKRYGISLRQWAR